MKTKQLQPEWKEVQLSEVSLIDSGQGAPQGEEYFDGEEIFVRAGDLNKLTRGIFVGDYCEKITSKAIEEYKLKKYKKGSIVFPKSGMSVNTGNIAILKEDSYVVNHLAIIEPNLKIDNLFLFYLFKKRGISHLSQDASYPSIRLSDIKSIKIPLPPLQTQKAIVSILEKAEQLRGKRNQTIEYLDEYLKSVFNEMFLKEKFEEVELGEITKIISGSTPSTQKEEYWNGEINWVTPAELIDGPNYYYYGTQRKITKEGLKSCSAELFPQNTVILTTRAPIGKVAIAGIEMCSNQGFKNFICDKSKLNHVYLYFWFLLNKKQLQSFGHGATFGEVSKSIVSKIKIPLPSLALQQTFASIVEHVEKLKEKQKQSLNEIEQLNGVLMQKAFKGELVR